MTVTSELQGTFHGLGYLTKLSKKSSAGDNFHTERNAAATFPDNSSHCRTIPLKTKDAVGTAERWLLCAFSLERLFKSRIIVTSSWMSKSSRRDNIKKLQNFHLGNEWVASGARLVA